MQRAKKILIGEEEYILLYSMGAMAALWDEDDDVQKLMLRCAEMTGRGIRALCRTAAVLSQAGAAAMRAAGMDGARSLTEEKLLAVLTPEDMPVLLDAVTDAIRRGIASELDESYEQEVDVVLEELKKKTGVRTVGRD